MLFQPKGQPFPRTGRTNSPAVIRRRPRLILLGRFDDPDPVDPLDASWNGLAAHLRSRERSCKPALPMTRQAAPLAGGSAVPGAEATRQMLKELES